MTFIFGTRNPAKLDAVRGYVKPVIKATGLTILGLNEINASVPDVDEQGNDPLENARLKAAAYYASLGRPVFSCDSGLHIEGLPPDLQPGIHIRRVGGKRLTDAEMTAYYGGLAASRGGRLVCRYVNAVCLVAGEGKVFEHAGDDIASKPFILCDKPHVKRVEGFPLDRLSLRIEDGMYHYDYEAVSAGSEQDGRQWGLEQGFCDFFTRVITELEGTAHVQ